MIGLADVRAAARRIEGFTRRTPVIASEAINARVGARVWLKAENLQLGGAFKVRGAYNAIASLSPEERARGVIAVSSGNHARAVALAAEACTTTALILMPEDAPEVKRRATAVHAAEVRLFDRYLVDREELLNRTTEETGRVVVHPFDDERVMAGQGTVALELVHQAGPLDDLVVPIGGGGLASGCVTVMSAHRRGTRTWGVEPEDGDDVRRSLALGRRVSIEVPRTIADGQQLVSPGALPFEVMQQRIHEVVTVSDEEIVEAMRVLFEECRLVVEPSGATALAALLAGKVDVAGKRVGVIVSGGNVDLARYIDLLRP